MSDGFDIEKFSENAQRLTETLEKTGQYVNDIDRTMAHLYEEMHGANIDADLEKYSQRLKEIQQGSQQILEVLSERPAELQETAKRLSEISEQFGTTNEYLQNFQERTETLTGLLENIGNLSGIEERLKKYEADLSKTSETIEQIRKQEMEIRNLPNVLKAMKESVTDLQKQYMEAAADLRDQGNEALGGVRSVKESVQKAENLQRTLSEQVTFFKIGIYAMIIMNTLMTIFLAIFLVKELFF